MVGRLINKPEGMSPETWQRQELEFDKEAESLREAQAEAHQFITSQLRGAARILVLDVGQRGWDPAEVEDEALVSRAREQVYGGKDVEITHGEIFRQMLGFEPGDEQVTIWHLFEQEELPKDMPYPDAWIMTGGPAMPTELEPDKETENTPWLKDAVAALQKLSELKIPGVAVCLGHQLLEYTRGAKLGKKGTQMEFGTKDMQLTDIGKTLQLLFGTHDEGTMTIGASHFESVLQPPSSEQYPNSEVVAFNDYSAYQAAAHPLREGQTVGEANAEDDLILSIQNHPEISTVYLEIVRRLYGQSLREQALQPEEIVFKDTPEVRKIWFNFLQMVERRMRAREGSKKEI